MDAARKIMPWSQTHLDHAINFMGTNWLVIVDAYSTYLCIHATLSITAKAIMYLMEKVFAHFGYPHTIVSDNSTSLWCEELHEWCRKRGITHLTGASYPPATNCVAKRLVQSFKQALRKSALLPQATLNEILMHYRRTPLEYGYSPNKLMNGQQMQYRIAVLLLSSAHLAYGKQWKTKEWIDKLATKDQDKMGAVCYDMYCGPVKTENMHGYQLW